jgi:hypothetical protein
MLKECHTYLLTQATNRLLENTLEVNNYQEMKSLMLEKYNFYKVPWKCDTTNEAYIKEDSKVTIRCYLDEPILNKTCFFSGNKILT